MTTKFLIVDDEPDIELLMRHWFRKKLRAGDYAFVFASSGGEALERLAEHDDIALVLSDINMPGMDGLTLLAHIATLDRQVKVVMVSAYGDLANIRAAMNGGAFDFVTKPIDVDDLTVTIDKSLREVAILHQARELEGQFNTIQRELDIARDIQTSMLPRRFPDRTEFDLHALAVPAREVGGDFYDFIDDNPDRLAFAIADVAGKGLGAALFMAITRMVMRTSAFQELPLAAYIQRVNWLVSAEAVRMPRVFVTAFAALLDVETGTVTYCNAGHNQPVLLRRDGTTSMLPRPNGPALCLVPDFSYGAGEIQLAPGDTLLLYTDGVTEAFNGDKEEFSEERLSRTLEEATGRSAEGVLEHVFAAVRMFANGTPQSDDITMLALQYRGSSGRAPHPVERGA